jgi:hypothetical protein
VSLLCLTVGVAAAAETRIDFDRLSIDEGLSQSIFEDGSGILWVGAFEGGLNRWTRQLAASAAILPATVWPATPSTRWSSTPQPAT